MADEAKEIDLEETTDPSMDSARRENEEGDTGQLKHMQYSLVKIIIRYVFICSLSCVQVA